jgi:4-hydroxybenzoate polyprenyltransferase
MNGVPRARNLPRSLFMMWPLARTVFVTLLWPAAAAVSLAVAVRGWAVSSVGLGTLVGGTMAGYALDRLNDRHFHDPPGVVRFLKLALLAAATATAILAIQEEWRIAVCAVLALLAAAYIPLKRAVPKNVIATTAWTIAVIALPGHTLSEISANLLPAAAALALLVYANTTLCDLGTIAEDRRAGVRSLSTRFGSRAAFAAFAVAGFGAVVAARYDFWGLCAAAVGHMILAMLVAKWPAMGSTWFVADAIITLVPGPLALWLQP